MLISVIMPSFNQTQFLPAAIDSVLSYDGDLELIVMDGGSTDGSVEVLEHYGPRLTHWQSAPDGGQAAAINAGFARAQGEVLCWLNSDDMHVPGALTRVAVVAGERPRRFLRYGSAIHLREGLGLSAVLAPAYPTDGGRLTYDDVMVQPSAFWSRDVWESTGPLDETMHFAFDWDWFIRAQSHADFDLADEVYSIYRLHEGHKTGSGGSRRRHEIAAVVARHATTDWADLYHRLLDVVEAQQPRITALQRAGLSFHRAALVAAASRGLAPHSVGEARRWSFVFRMYA